MDVFYSNEVKIYNLSAGKSLPDWISARKRRLLLKKDVDRRNRIELIQDFEMPGVTTGIKMSRDGQYVLATGVYKPRVRCYDVNNFSMKFERCFNSEAEQFLVLSDDYEKMIFLQCDRYVEFHVRYGYYHRFRIPKFGRDIAYQYDNCDLYFATSGSQVYRFNLEQGRFLTSIQTDASSMNKCAINREHGMIALGSPEGKVEAWDPRDYHRIGILDCVESSITKYTDANGFPEITALQFNGGLTMAVGTATGQILLYDIRANKPFVVRDHMYGKPIKNIQFIKNEDLVASLDVRCLKIWKQSTGEPYTCILSIADFNDMCIVPDTGLMFLACEDKKIQTYYVPAIGPAPRWCSYLDNMVEELEESSKGIAYDNYKFVTKKDLEELHLTHLIGTNMLRAYTHGYYMDIRLYNKAKSIIQPFAYTDFKNKKIREKIEDERKNRVMMKQLPTVNRELAKRLMEQKLSENPSQQTSTVLDDPRFKEMFENPDFQIDETAEEYNLIRPLFTKLEKSSQKRLSTIPYDKFEAVEDEQEMKNNYENSESEENSSSEDEPDDVTTTRTKRPKFYEMKKSEKFSMLKKKNDGEDYSNMPLGERLKLLESQETSKVQDVAGNKVVSFTLKNKKTDSQKKREEENKAHMKERARLRRPANFRRKRR